MRTPTSVNKMYRLDHHDFVYLPSVTNKLIQGSKKNHVCHLEIVFTARLQRDKDFTSDVLEPEGLLQM